MVVHFSLRKRVILLALKKAISAFPHEAILDPIILNKFAFLGKVMEKVVAQLLQGTLDDLELFQSGFRSSLRLIWLPA